MLKYTFNGYSYALKKYREAHKSFAFENKNKAESYW